jgi:uncharacterized protein (TIGR00369 family)
MKKLSVQTARALKKRFSAVPFISNLKMRLGTVGAGRARVSIDFVRRLGQVHGFMHGGVLASLADTAATYAANTLLFPERDALTVELKINYLAPLTTKKAQAEAVILHSGRKTSIAEVKVFDSNKKLCAVALITNLILPQGTIKKERR